MLIPDVGFFGQKLFGFVHNLIVLDALHCLVQFIDTEPGKTAVILHFGEAVNAEVRTNAIGEVNDPNVTDVLTALVANATFVASYSHELDF